MRKTFMAALLAGSMGLSACASVDDARMSDVGTGAAIGAVGGAGVGAVVGGVSPIEGAVVGAAIGGLACAVCRQQYEAMSMAMPDGTYYQGRPSGWDSTLGSRWYRGRWRRRTRCCRRCADPGRQPSRGATPVRWLAPAVLSGPTRTVTSRRRSMSTVNITGCPTGRRLRPLHADGCR